MKEQNGKIAYHSYIIKEDGFYFVQYNSEGDVDYEKRIHTYNENDLPINS